MTEAAASAEHALSLSTAAARNLATTTKSVPQMQEISSRWLLRVLPWVHVPGGTYRVNRRLTYALGDGRLTFVTIGAEVRVVPQELRELPKLREFDDDEVLAALADRFEQREYAAGDVIAEAGQPVAELILIAHGKVDRIGTGRYGDPTALGVLADGQYAGEAAMLEEQADWAVTLRAKTPCIALVLTRQSFAALGDRAEVLRNHTRQAMADARRPQNQHGEAAIEMASGHAGEPDLPRTFVDYELTPREYELSLAQTVLRVHTRVTDLYNSPMNQFEQQLRLTVEAVRERQEHELINSREFGLLHNADLSQRIHTRAGPPTPDDLDDLLATVWKRPGCFLAHPRTIAAFGRECSSRGVYPPSVEFHGPRSRSWRGVPMLPCDKIPISTTGTSSILLMRTGEVDQGVIGLYPTGLPEEHSPGLSVRFMKKDEKAIQHFMVTAYYSVAVLVPDALGVLENVEIGR